MRRQTSSACCGRRGNRNDGANAEVIPPDELAFQQLYTSVARSLRAYILRMTSDRSTADDLTQETFLRFLKAERKPASEEDRRKYLFGIASNLVNDHFRGSKRQWEEFDETHVSGVPVSSNLKIDLTSALRSLSARQRQLLWLAYAEQFSHAEIAEVTGLAVESIRPLLFHARRKAAGLLRDSGYDPIDTAKE